jgi:hypothetical protein
LNYLRAQVEDASIVGYMRAVGDYPRRVAAYFWYGKMVSRRVAAGETMASIQKQCGLSPAQHSYGMLISRFDTGELETLLDRETPPTIKTLAAMKRMAQARPNPCGRRQGTGKPNFTDAELVLLSEAVSRVWDGDDRWRTVARKLGVTIP